MSVNLNYTKGQDFVRFVMAQVAGKAGPLPPDVYAATRWGEFSPAAQFSKAAVTGGSLGGTTWGSSLDNYLAAAAEFLSAVREQSIVGRIPGLRRVPLNVRVIQQGAAAGAYWVGEGRPKLVTKAGYTAATLPPLKIAALAVLTDELVRFSGPEGEATIRTDLIEAVAKGLDNSFIDPANAGAARVEPASITNGITPVIATGDHEADLLTLINLFDGDLTRAVFIARPEVFIVFSGANNPAIGARGGELKGIPAIASRNVPDDVLVLADAGAIAFGGSNEVDVRVSRQATIEMVDTSSQTSLAGTGAQIVSLFQVNASAVLIEQPANWVARADAVAMLTGLSSSG